jgi:hypothetical protein
MEQGNIQCDQAIHSRDAVAHIARRQLEGNHTIHEKRVSKLNILMKCFDSTMRIMCLRHDELRGHNDAANAAESAGELGRVLEARAGEVDEGATRTRAAWRLSVCVGGGWGSRFREAKVDITNGRWRNFENTREKMQI